MESVDTRLLAGDRINSKQEETEAARRIRQSKKDYSNQGQEDEIDQEVDPENQGIVRSLAKKRKKVTVVKDEDEKLGSSAKTGSKLLLRLSWYFFIPSWGLSLLYINAHLILKTIVGERFFCKLGEEWNVNPITSKSPIAKARARTWGLIELMLVITLNIVFLLGVIFALGVVIMIINFMAGMFGWFLTPFLWIADLFS